MSLINILIVCLIIVILFAVGYNRGVVLRNYVQESFSTMDVYLKKRWDLIPNLVAVVKGYAQHEKTTLEEVTKLRNYDYSEMSNNEKIDINKTMQTNLFKLVAVAENYPDLKADTHFAELMNNLSATEDDIANSRKYYNGCVRIYNNFIQMFPTNIISAVCGFKEEKMFEINENERINVKVDLK